ncbi:zinc-binding dehydrogenase [Streptomyces olivaceoviridis]
MIAVVGLGGLGLNGVRTGVLAGATVYGVDINPDTFDAARAAGASDCFTDVAALADLRPDAVVDFAGVGSTTSAAVDVVRRRGRVVVVGLGTRTTSFSTGNLVRKSVELRGSYGASKDEYRQVLDFIAQGRIEPVVEEIPFADLGEGLDRIRRGAVRGRLAVRPGK